LKVDYLIERQVTLYSCKELFRKRCDCRIGSYKGKLAIYLDKRSKKERVRVYQLIHMARTQRGFKDYMKKIGVDDMVIPVTNALEEAAKDFNSPVKFVFIDGNHQHTFVKRDFELWFPKVINGRIMTFNDATTWPGSKKGCS